MSRSSEKADADGRLQRLYRRAATLVEDYASRGDAGVHRSQQLGPLADVLTEIAGIPGEGRHVFGALLDRLSIDASRKLAESFRWTARELDAALAAARETGAAAESPARPLGAAFDLLSHAMMRFGTTSSARGQVLSAWEAFDREWEKQQGRILEAVDSEPRRLSQEAVPSYRRARIDDLEQLRWLQGVCFEPELHDDDDAIRACIELDVHVVAEAGGSIVGAAVATTRPEFAGASPLHLYAVEVVPAYRGRGIAKELVRRVFRELPPSWIVMTAEPVTPEGWRLVASLYPRLVPLGWPELIPAFQVHDVIADMADRAEAPSEEGAR